MIYVLKFLYTLILPPGIFIILLVIFSCQVYRRMKRWAIILWILSFLLYLISTPAVGERLVHSLESNYQPPSSMQGDVIVMLTGGATADTPSLVGLGHPSGSTANRILTAAELFKKTNLPIIISGGQVFDDTGNEGHISKQNMLALGVPENKIILDDTSLNTTQNAQNTKILLDKYDFKHPVLVTSAFHMKRALENFKKLHVNVTAFPTDYIANKRLSLRLSKFEPAYEGIYFTGIALKEYLGIFALKLG